MKKITALLLTCALTITSNSFGMLTKTSFHTKKLRPFSTKTNSNDHPLIFKRDELNFSTKDNRDLLREIIEQNKENNELLRAVLKQNALHFSIQHNYQFKGPTAKHYGKLAALYKEVENKYDISKINPNE